MFLLALSFFMSSLHTRMISFAVLPLFIVLSIIKTISDGFYKINTIINFIWISVIYILLFPNDIRSVTVF